MVVPDMIKDNRDFGLVIFVLNIQASSLFNTTGSPVNNILCLIRVLIHLHISPHGNNTINRGPSVCRTGLMGCTEVLFQLPSPFIPDRFPAFQALPLALSDQELSGLFLVVSIVKGM